MSVNFNDSLIQATKLTGEHVQNHFTMETVMSNKSDKQELGSIDMQCHKMVMDILKDDFGNNILSEESSKEERERIDLKKPFVIVDPRDGTSNAMRGLPYYATTVALMEGNQVLESHIYMPSRDVFISSALGSGTYVNDKRFHLNETVSSSMEKGIWSFESYDESYDHFLSELICGLGSIKHKIQNHSAVYSMGQFASGDGVSVVVDLVDKLWDVAAGALAAHEAGGFVVTGDIMGNQDLVYKPEFAIAKKTVADIYDGTFQCVVADNQERLKSIIKLAGVATQYAPAHKAIMDLARKAYSDLAK